MTPTSPRKFSVSWSTFKSSFCEGLAGLQQNEQLVDMTLAADGHFVKVHKIVLALASPYLKDLMSAVPCEHPVIFLNDVPSYALSLILEYIYTGETLVPAECMTQFAKVGKALRINGLENLPAANHKVEKKPDVFNVGISRNSSTKVEANKPNLLLTRSSYLDKNLRHDINISNNKTAPAVKTQQPLPQTYLKTETAAEVSPEDMDFEEQENEVDDIDDLPKCIEDLEKMKTKLLYTISIRGCLQIILNRYIYNLEYAKTKGIRRWRCIDYRNRKCPAWLMTKNNIVVNRSNPHNHPFHDKKILDKVDRRTVYTAIEEAEKIARPTEVPEASKNGKKEWIIGK